MIKNEFNQSLSGSKSKSVQARSFFVATATNDEHYKRLCYTQT